MLQTIKQTKDAVSDYEALSAKLEDAIALADMAIEENEEGYAEEVKAELEFVEKEEERRLFYSYEYKNDFTNRDLIFFLQNTSGSIRTRYVTPAITRRYKMKRRISVISPPPRHPHPLSAR